MKDTDVKLIKRALKEAQERRIARAYVRMKRMEDAWKEAQREVGGGYVPEGDARVNGSRNVLESASVCKGGDVEEEVVCTNCEVLLRVRKVLKERS